MGSGEINDDFLGDSNSSSDDEGGDEAEKFKNTFLKNKNGSKFFMFQGKQENNLLIKE
jgi:hypothetical protein